MDIGIPNIRLFSDIKEIPVSEGSGEKKGGR